VKLKVLFLHGLESKPGGTKATFLKKEGYDVLNPALPRNDFEISVKVAQDAIDTENPDLVVGSSRGGAVAMSVSTRGAPLILIAPAWQRYMSVRQLGEFKVRLDSQKTIILHSDNDDVVLPEDSNQLESMYGIKKISVGENHRMSDDEALEALLDSAKWLLKS
tara:strand:- start:3424 stop:3912 length:489 start_codon:yes stop_codon:yes gene_type:complete